MKTAIFRHTTSILAVCLLATLYLGSAALGQHSTGAGVTVSTVPGSAIFTNSGLTGNFYSVSTTGQNTGKFLINSLSTAQTWINTDSTTGTFISTAAALADTGDNGNGYESKGGYGGPKGNDDDTTPIKTFLAADGSSYNGPNDIMGTSIIEMKGYIDVTGLATTGRDKDTLTIHMGSNDGSYLAIGGVPVITDLEQNETSASGQSEANTVLFQNGDGLYSIDLIYWNQEFSNGANPNQGLANFLALQFSGANVALYQVVPEPGPIAAFAVAGMMLAALLLRGRLKARSSKSA